MTPPKGKQRSIHMDDETFELLQTLALKHKANNSTIVRMALAAYADGGQTIYRQPPVDAERLTAVGEKITEIKNNERNIVLPDPAISTFKVAGDKVIGKRPRSAAEDDGLDV